MQPNNQPGRPPEQGQQWSGQAQQGWEQPEQRQPAQTTRPATEGSVSEPTLQWVQIGSQQEQVTLGPKDYVLDSFFNPQYGTWEVLVLLKPETEGEDED
ncbi:hypothetical protein [Haloarchaeobius sp. HRN-SO-5]|uniref:hypothetical protein n=1 Tax=Haloarchaeobius sp. HRN-SO-5 TaxID=3446118 RepID=UPI003EBAE5A5